MTGILLGTTAAPVLETDRLRLRGWRPDDFESYRTLLSDLETARFITRAGAPLSESAVHLAAARRWLQAASEDARTGLQDASLMPKGGSAFSGVFTDNGYHRAVAAQNPGGRPG